MKKCAGCSEDLPWDAFDKYDSYHAHGKCKKCEENAEGKMKTCKRCKDELPKSAFNKLKGRYERYDVCAACQHPSCAKCGAERKSIWKPNPRAKDPAKLCDKCERKEKKKKPAGLKKK